MPNALTSLNSGRNVMSSPSSGRPSLGLYRWRFVVSVGSVVGVAIFSAVALMCGPSGSGKPQGCVRRAARPIDPGSILTAGSEGCLDLQKEACYGGVTVSDVPGVHPSE